MRRKHDGASLAAVAKSGAIRYRVPMARRTCRIFVLSPAHCGGERARLVLGERASFDLARRVRTESGAPLGEVFSFFSGLYFRGKLSYARAFAQPLADDVGIYVITPTEGLLPVDEPVNVERLRGFASVDIDSGDRRYREPLGH